MILRSLTHPTRAAGLAIALSLAALTGPAAAQTIVNPPGPGPVPILPPVVWPCSQIASISPASARPGQDVDIHITPPSGRPFFFNYSVTGVQFANGLSVPFTNVAAHHVRAKVPVGSATGPVQVSCRTPITGATWSITSATAFTPISFGNTLNPNAATLHVGSSTTVTATLSHPAPEPIALTLDPQSNALSVLNLGPGATGTVTIPMGQRSASFSVTARAAAPAPAGAGIVVSGPNVASSTLTVTVPTPAFSLSVADPDAEVHWGNSASYSAQVSSQYGFAGTVTLSASGLPVGATAAPVTVNVPAGGSANATFTVSTAHVATALGTDSFDLKGVSPGASDRSRTLDLRVLPEAGEFDVLEQQDWRTVSSDCPPFEADVNGSNITFDGPGFTRTQAITHLRYAWTPGCRGAVVLGTSLGQNLGWPASIFNFGFGTAIGARGSGNHQNIGAAAWNTDHFQVSPDGSYVIGVAQGTEFHANLYDMLNLAHRPPMHGYTLVETLPTSIVGNQIQARPSAPGTGSNWEWNLP